MMTEISVEAPAAEPACREFPLPQDGDFPVGGFVVRHSGQVTAFVNRCPHTGAPLNWKPDDFLTADGQLIQCSLHGALFDPADGRCLRGPCAGDRLQQLPLRYADGRWLVDAAQAGNSLRSGGK
ncbi:Rieske 2Fe-2S domain-containing protein [Granulosicoccaceae sp. 1_MG-2023]|nr:Rieske 2Fe-2S domain-containing protein [Granulosicoccaceae sp. 1_MG-2023]